jgi:predicted ATPase
MKKQSFALSWLAKIYADLGRYDDARRTIGEALATIEASGERWFEAEVKRMAGEIALLEPKPGVPKAEVYFNRALDVARRQQAKSWELRAAMSMARL